MTRSQQAPLRPAGTIVALYDIHGNLPALEVVLAEVDAMEVDLLVIGGDVFPGPMAEDCLARLLALTTPLVFVRGNGEREVLAARRGESSALPDSVHTQLKWHAEQLTDEHARFLGTWPLRRTVAHAQRGSVTFCHATADSDSQIVTERTPEPEFRAAFAGAAADLVICGHTHMPFDRSVGAQRVINAGSVGMPFGAPGADWLVLDASGGELRHTNYDLDEAAERLRGSAWPGAAEFAERSVLDPPTTVSMLEVFERSRAGTGR